MKKILVALSFLALAVSAQAQHNRNYNHHQHRHNDWVTPAIIGGVIGYALTRNHYEPVYNYGYVAPPVYVQRTVVVPSYGQVCTPWIETQNPDGTITRQRTCQ